MHNLDSADLELVESTKTFLTEHYAQDKHHVACGLRCGDKIYYALHMDSRGFDVCAEPIALSNAFLDKQEELHTIVAVSWNGKDAVKVISPCGNCRQILSEYSPGIQVIFPAQDSVQKIPLATLLPYPYV